jgi:asparagine synthase (glutamine-hydrolysing)
MSGIAGFAGPGDPAAVDAMLAAIGYRGDRTDVASGPGFALGYRWWGGRPGKSPGIHRAPDGAVTACAGTLAPSVPSPAEDLDARIREGRFSRLDGAFAAARFDPATRTLTLIRDPFGVRSIYVAEHAGALWFASEIKQLLAIPGFPAELDHAAIHKYLAFSFVPGEAVPIHGVRRLLPAHRLTRRDGVDAVAPYFTLREDVDPALTQGQCAARIGRLGLEAVQKRLNGEANVGLYLSGGIDSAAVAVWLKDAGASTQAFTLDFGDKSVELVQAEQVAASLGMPIARVPATGALVGDLFEELVHRLDLPFGDGVTGPHLLLAKAARAAGLDAVFNGEGGDQLFGGWTSKPMVAAAVYRGLYGDETPEEQYLRSYHRFWGAEDALYTPEFAAQVGPAGTRRALLTPYLGDGGPTQFLNRVRLTDIALKGSQNILPRAERLANACGLDVRVPLFDRRLAVASFKMPPELKLKAACEKYVFKLALQDRLPHDIVWRRKFGMSVPMTDWVTGPLAALVEELLGERSIRARGLFRPEYVAKLRSGEAEPGETRRRRLGEKLWALMMLEGWLRAFVDRRGAR